MPLEARPGLISLLAGKPNSDAFPFTALGFKFRDPMDLSREISLDLTPKELAVGLQYGPTGGLDGLVTWVYGLQEKVHGRRKGEGWKASIGAGSQDLIYKVNRQYISESGMLIPCRFRLSTQLLTTGTLYWLTLLYTREHFQVSKLMGFTDYDKQRCNPNVPNASL